MQQIITVGERCEASSQDESFKEKEWKTKNKQSRPACQDFKNVMMMRIVISNQFYVLTLNLFYRFYTLFNYIILACKTNKKSIQLRLKVFAY